MATSSNTVVIKVAAQTQEAEKGFDRIKRRAKSLSLDMAGLSGTLAGFNKLLNAVGLSSLSLGYAMKTVSQTTGEVARTTAFTRSVVGALGEEFQRNLVSLAPSFKEVGREFGFTSREVENAYGVIARESRTATLGLEDLRFSMGLARAAGLDLTQAAGVVGRAIIGDVEPLRLVVGEVESYEEAQRAVIEAGRQSTAEYQKVGAQFKDFIQTLGKGVDAVLKITAGLKGIVAYASSALYPSLETGIKTVGTFGGALTSASDSLTGLQRLMSSLGSKTISVSLSFLSQVPWWFSTAAEWAAHGAVLSVTAVGDFFTRQAPQWLEMVARGGVSFSVSATGDFFSQTLPAWFNSVSDFFGSATVRALEVTLSFGTRFSSTASRFFSVTGQAVPKFVQTTIAFVAPAFSLAASRFFDATGEAIWRSVGATLWFANLAMNSITGRFVSNAGDMTWQSVGATLRFAGVSTNWITDRFMDALGFFKTQVMDVALNFSLGAIQGIGEFAKIVANAVIENINSVAWSWFPKIPSFTISQPVSAVQGPGIPGGATGGIFGGPTVVGERGPELVTLPMGSHVRPSLAGASNLGSTVNIIVQGNVVVDDEVRMRTWAREIQQLLSENARRGVSI